MRDKSTVPIRQDENPTGSAPRFGRLAKGSAVVVLVLALAAAYAFKTFSPRSHEAVPIAVEKPVGPPPIVEVSAADAEALLTLIDGAWRASGAPEVVPGIAPLRFPEGLDRLEKEDRKQTFLLSILPHVLHANEAILAQRLTLEEVARRLEEGQPLSAEDEELLRETAKVYRMSEVSIYGFTRRFMRDLLARVDIVPPSLVLAQAAKESGWGTSRFVQERNNLFGQRTILETPGVPATQDQPQDAVLKLSRYATLRDSVDAYFFNLNTFGAYDRLRDIRAKFRAEGKDVDPEALAAGLHRYS
ncbi:MAG TPA: glucosaminidase domain-containing protein, partial [Geobacteraceae bacterium]